MKRKKKIKKEKKLSQSNGIKVLFLGTIESSQAQLVSADYSPNCRTNRPRLLEFLMSPQRCNIKSYDYQVASAPTFVLHGRLSDSALTGCERLPPERMQRGVSTAPGACGACGGTLAELSKPGRHCWIGVQSVCGEGVTCRGDNPLASKQHAKETQQDKQKKGRQGALG